MKKTVFFIVHYLQNVGMSAYEDFRPVHPQLHFHPGSIVPGIAADVGYHHWNLFAFEQLPPPECHARLPSVDVAVHAVQRPEGGNGVGRFDGAEVSGMS